MKWEPMPDKPLDANVLSPDVEKLQRRLTTRIIGQERAIRRIIKAYAPTTVNLHREGRPMGVFLFMGPTGVGKSETVKEFAAILLGNRDAITKIDCTEYQSSHETAKLLGSPPGYIGYGDKPRLSQENIDKFQKPESKINIVLFDEIEKADDKLFDSILSIIGDGQLTLGNGKPVDFSRTFVFLTSNLGSQETRVMIEGSGIGFKSSEVDRAALDDKIYRASKEAVKKKFRPEFINRLDSIVVFRSLSGETLKMILSKELINLQWSIWKSTWRDFVVGTGKELPGRMDIRFTTTESCREFLLKEGTSEIYGARELNRIIDRYLRYPLAALISSGQLISGERVKADYVEGAKELTFTKTEETI